MVKIDKEKCNGCGSCVETCPTQAISLVDSKATVNEQCIDCGACIGACPTQAITLD